MDPIPTNIANNLKYFLQVRQIIKWQSTIKHNKYCHELLATNNDMIKETLEYLKKNM